MHERFATARRKQVPVTVLAAALSACVVESEQLNSERIESRFGSYGIEVLSSKDGVRRSNLYSVDGDRRICRTYAVVRFDDVPESIIDREHAQILAGQSIGAIFKHNGWAIFKETRYVGTHRFERDEHPVYALMARGDAPDLAMHVYRLLLKKDSQVIEYATIIELHHPDYMGPEEIAELYVVDAPAGLGDDALDAFSELVDNTAW